ncbi:hypothetical protein PN836_015855 [Ningiella sp. W23]|uniref:hypothetical protein n=1 Tax=Ningiella sp. W23 TaxID=3023715 RepID=UPI003757C4C7
MKSPFLYLVVLTILISLIILAQLSVDDAHSNRLYDKSSANAQLKSHERYSNSDLLFKTASDKFAHDLPIESAQSHIKTEATPRSLESFHCEDSLDFAELVSKLYKDSIAYGLTENRFEGLKQAFANIHTRDSLLSLATFERLTQSGKAFSVLKSALSTYPSDEFISYRVLLACVEFEAGCDSALVEQASQVDTENSLHFLLRANLASKAKDEDAAEGFMQQAAQAKRYSIYWAEHIGAMERAFAQAGAGNSDSTQAVLALYTMAIPLPSYSNLIAYCREAEESDYSRLKICEQVASIILASKSSSIDVMIGLALRQIIAIKRNEPNALETLLAEEQDLRLFMEKSLPALDILFRNPKRLSDWSEQMKRSGEHRTLEYALDEVNRLLSDPEFDPCQVDWQLDSAR